MPGKLLGTYSENPEFLATAKLVVQQNEGETIFVPSGWYHQVRNLEETVSINHNWINCASIENTWLHLQNELILVENELEYLHSGMDDDEWIDICQKILRAQTSMDFADFEKFLGFFKDDPAAGGMKIKVAARRVGRYKV